VVHQQKALLKMVEERPGKNLITLSRTALLKKGSLAIYFSDYDTSMVRTVEANDTNRSGQQYWENVGKKLLIPNTDLLKLLNTHQRIILTYTEIPRDPEKAMLVRVRPIELCIIGLK
jgi:hypothetical protein